MSPRIYVCARVRETDRMGMRWRAETDSEGALQTVSHEGRTLRDRRGHMEGARRVTQPRKEQRPFKADSGMHHIEPVAPTHYRGQTISRLFL